MLKFDRNDRAVRFRKRVAKSGPEAHLVDAFMSEYVRKLEGSGDDYAVFYEPQMPTGYPDCVVVRYDAKAYSTWKKDAEPLSDSDMRVLHYLAVSHGGTAQSISKNTGYREAELALILNRLAKRSFVKRIGSRWVAAPMGRSCGIEKVVTIEAKISDWNRVIDQAVLNRTFANESYVLVPVRQPTPMVLREARSSGVGVYTMPTGSAYRKVQSPAMTKGLSSSYAVWYFNEWIGRRLAVERSRQK